MTDTLIKADVFFFITSVAVIVIALLFVVGLLYLIRILRIIKKISQHAEKTADLVAHDIVELRNDIKQNGISPKRILNFFSRKSKTKK